jgi:hypothetical protein
MTIEARRASRVAGAMLCALVVLLIAVAPPVAHADTIYPTNQITGSSFDSGTDGWSTVSNSCKLLLGLITTNDPATCQTETTHAAADGNPAGSLQQDYQAVANALSPLLFSATAIAKSPDFLVTTGGPTSFQVDRRADVLALLDLGTNATYTFSLVDTADETSQVLFTENVTDSDNAFQSVLNEALTNTITGHTYRIEVKTVFNTALASVALGRMVVDFDNVRVRVQDGTTTFGAPTVVTDPATDITATAATLNGRVNANGLATTFVYRYGTAADSLTNTIGPDDGGMLTHAVSRPRDISGLTGCTQYFFQIEATNSAGTSTGLTQSFRTDCKPTVTTLPATGVGPNSAAFNSRINPEGPATKYYYEYGTVASGTFASRTPASGDEVVLPASHADSVPNTYPVGGLVPETAYHFRVVAFNDLGTSTGLPLTFTTSGTGEAGPPGDSGAAGPPGAAGLSGGGGSGLNTQILDLLNGDKRAMLRIDGQRLVLPMKGRYLGRLRIRIVCRKIAVRTCSGTVKIRSRGKINTSTKGKKLKKKKVTFATGPVQLDTSKVGYAIIQFNQQRTDLVRVRKSIKVEVIAAMIDADNNRQNIRSKATLVRGKLPKHKKK